MWKIKNPMGTINFLRAHQFTCISSYIGFRRGPEIGYVSVEMIAITAPVEEGTDIDGSCLRSLVGPQ